MFEKASRLKLRFEVITSQSRPCGFVSVEDLWDLNLEILDSIAKKINTELKSEGEESFIPSNKSKKAAIYELKLEILKYIIGIKLKEKEEKEKDAAKKAQREKIKALIAKKEDESMESLTIEELKELLK